MASLHVLIFAIIGRNTINIPENISSVHGFPGSTVKALPLIHFWSVLLLEEQMMTSVKKMLKNAGLIRTKPIDF